MSGHGGFSGLGGGGGGSSGSNSSNKGSTQTFNYHKVEIDSSKSFDINYTTKYNGSADEMSRANQITSVYLSNAIDKGTQIGMFAADVESGTGMMAYNNNAKAWHQKLKSEGYEPSIKGAVKMMVDKSPTLNAIKDAKTAKEVIDKYGSKVSKDRKPTRVLNKK